MQRDRACGVLLATAAGDALGAGYEFGPPLPDEAPVTMRGGGGFNWEPGEWTDDTAMAIAIAEVAATGADLRSVDAQDRIVARWVGWSRTAADVGNQTSQVLGRVLDGGVSGAAAAALAASADLHERTGRTAGNGSLMRTAPVALAYLDDPDGLAEAAMAVSALTHFDRSAGEACVLWCLAIRHAVLTGALNPRAGLEYLPAEQRASGPRGWTPPRDCGRATSATTAGSSRRCRPRGARSSARHIRFPARTRRSAFRLPIGYGCRSRSRYGAAATRTRWPRSPAASSARPSARPPFPLTGGQRSTAGPATTPLT